jgi:hypothetical protein
VLSELPPLSGGKILPEKLEAPLPSPKRGSICLRAKRLS